jgi:tyrocidine synthetase-3
VKRALEPRYYRGLCPPYRHEPTRDRIAVVATDDCGEGLISLVCVPQHAVVFSFFGAERSDQTLYTLQQQPGSYVEDPLVMGKVLHACAPNMVCDMTTRTFTALRPIYVGQYLTMDYDTTEDELFRPFDCQCGSDNCRGAVRGRLRRPALFEPALQTRRRA